MESSLIDKLYPKILLITLVIAVVTLAVGELYISIDGGVGYGILDLGVKILYTTPFISIAVAFIKGVSKSDKVSIISSAILLAIILVNMSLI